MGSISSFFTLLFSFFSAVTPIIAAPLVERGINSDLLANFNLFEQYAAAAYCSGNNDSPNSKVTCPYGNCPLVQAASTITLTEFQNSLRTDVTGFVATDTTNNLTILSFRGSASIQNWLTNLDLSTIPTDLCPGCTAHSGFWSSWLESRTGVLDAIKTAARENPGYKLIVTGHSLGGAIATLAAAELRNSGYETALYTFGAPRIAGPKLSSFISQQPGGNYRVTHWNDPVPRLPPIPMGFVHVSPEYYIDKGNNQAVGSGDVKVLEGSVNLRGNSGWLVTDVGAHAWYFNDIAKCYTNALFNGKKRGVKMVKMF
ncbi:alpha/beta-hydrolase [Delitschia confertaspora ATCC 74209]|uniref:Alpha/beta-hydrolase n=1 Tax=Delitschia confertaspora ATCC 74209 TaxID=1513339 RepID=A0A9P4JEK7_9PLEO|nr:alpha/beta-hydrolase [Delitschia confertaspora ATCC 74209]